MKLYRLRFFIQSLSFAILVYGGRFGLRLGHFLPCFACPYIGSCSGDCYLMALQGPHWGAGMSLTAMISFWGVRALGVFIGFIILSIIFSKAWCGWICPFGTLQDWISLLRKRFAVRESVISWKPRDKLKSVKYLLLIFLIIIPVLIANAGLHPDFQFPFCQICPAKPLMPLLIGNFNYFAIDSVNLITTVMSMLSLVLAAAVLVGIIFKERFFCMFCPLLALVSIFDKAGIVKLKKNPGACSGCRNCQRVCPLDIREVHLDKKNITSDDCILCLKCLESCPQDNVLSLKFFKKTIFSSSGKYVSEYNRKRNRNSV